MIEFELVSNIVEKNGKTIKQNNLETKHTIPIGTLVETHSSNYSDDYEWIGIRLFITKHTRDCDGTPLYSLGCEGHDYTHGFSNEILKVIKETK